MTSPGTRDLAASVRQRLISLSRQRGDDLQLVLTRYGLEHLLFRVTRSPHAGQFVFKGRGPDSTPGREGRATRHPTGLRPKRRTFLDFSHSTFGNISGIFCPRRVSKAMSRELYRANMRSLAYV